MTATAALVDLPVPATWLKWPSDALAIALLARAVGDFRLVGFFKRVCGTRRARLDSIAYAPLSLPFATGVFYVATITVADCTIGRMRR